MNLARILYPVKVLGPGDRVGLWLCGCNRACRGCSNPELWRTMPEYEVTISEVFGLIQKLTRSHSIDGFTISGGEPMLQAFELAWLIRKLQTISEDILVYTGFQIEELREKKNPSIDTVLENIAVLIDGPYIEALNDDTLIRGSSNQRVHILNPVYRAQYEHYLTVGRNQIQNFTTVTGIVSVGIHRRGFTPDTHR